MPLDAVLAGKEVKKAHVDTVGCLIGRAREADSKSEITYSNQKLFVNGQPVEEKSLGEYYNEDRLRYAPLWSEKLGPAMIILAKCIARRDQEYGLQQHKAHVRPADRQQAADSHPVTCICRRRCDDHVGEVLVMLVMNPD